MRKRFVDIIRFDRPIRYVVALLILMGVLFVDTLVLRAEQEVGCQECKPGIALPDEPCRIKPWKELEWTEPEKWAWKEICEGRTANFNGLRRAKKLNPQNQKPEVLDPRNPLKWSYDFDYEWPSELRALRSRFLRTILLHEPFRSAIPHRGVRISGAYFKHAIDLRDASIERPLLIENSLFKVSVLMHRFTTSKFVSFQGSRFDGILDMPSAMIGGDLKMMDSKFKTMLNMKNVSVEGDLDMSSSSLFSRFISWILAEGIEPEKSEFYDVYLIGAKIRGDLLMREAELRNVVLSEAKLGGKLWMSRSKFKGKLNMSSALIEGDVLMRGAEFKNVVEIIRAKVGGKLEMFNSKFKDWLKVNSTSIEGDLLMWNSEFDKDVEMTRAKIGRKLDMFDSKFKTLLNMTSTLIEGDLIMREAEFNRPANLAFLTVSSTLNARGATLSGLDLTGARITGELQLGASSNKKIEWKGYKGLKRKTHAPQMTLRNARVGTLQVTKDAWPLSLELDGFIYKRLGVDREKTFIKRSDQYIEWLAKDKTYSPQPYLHLASVLRADGHEEMADKILYENRECELRGLNLWQLRWWVLSVLKVTIGYGYGWGYFQALVWVVALVGFGAIVLFVNEESYKKGDNQRIEKLGFAYSLDMLLPIIHLREEHYEVDLKTKVARYYFYVHKIIGYILIFFVIAGLTGLTEWGQTSPAKNMLSP